MKTFEQYLFESLTNQSLNENSSRYSVEVNYRTTLEEALEAFAKIALGYVSATLKGNNYHVKHVFSEGSPRILVSSRNWDDGEWVGIVSYEPSHKKFAIAAGFYNKDRRTVSVPPSNRRWASGLSAAEISKELVNMMHAIKGQKDRHQEKLKPVPLKRGPKS